MSRLFLGLLCVCVSACSVGNDNPDSGPGFDGGPCESGRLYCDGDTVLMCTDGVLSRGRTCTDGQVCAPNLGCVECQPGYHRCEGPDLYQCVADGSRWEVIQTCTPDQICIGQALLGTCGNACDEAVLNRSNIGCEYWAVDLDNEYGDIPVFGGRTDAYSQPFAVAIANPSMVTATVTIFVNDAQLGEAPAERQVFRGTVPARDVIEVQLGQREIDGPPGSATDTRGTWMSPNAFRITSNYPVVAYQFNPIVQTFSNDASLLIPTSGLDNHYRVLNWPTANPIELAGFNLEGVPDHSTVTVIGTEANTTVRVTLGSNIVGDNFGGEVTARSAGEVVEVTLGRYEVLNLESDGVPGDMTGTIVESSAPVAVFSGGERGIAPYDTTNVPAYPGGAPEDWCCTEHLEEQVFPTSSWGRDFVITRSPQRGVDWAEPDIYRIMADRTRTTVTTSLSGANASFTLEPGQWREFASQESFVLQADAAVSIEQIQVSQQWVVDWKPDHGGDPSMLLFPPYQQYRPSYVFLTPSTFSADYVVVSAPVGTQVLLDGRDINADEFDPLCDYEAAGAIEGVMYTAITCPVEDGAHTIDATQPVGIMVYGYYSVGSYGYVGGSGLERINLF